MVFGWAETCHEVLVSLSTTIAWNLWQYAVAFLGSVSITIRSIRSILVDESSNRIPSDQRSQTTQDDNELSEEKDDLLELVLQGPSTFDLALQLLQSPEHQHVQRVALWNYSRHTTVKIMETRSVVRIFQVLARLPHLQTLTISFNSPFPVAALTAFWNERHGRQRLDKSQRKPWSWLVRRSPPSMSSGEEHGLKQLILCVVELAGSQQELDQLALAMQKGSCTLDSLNIQCDPASDEIGRNNVPTDHHHHQVETNERMELRKQRLFQNERACISILKAVQRHSSLRELSLAVCLPMTRLPTSTTTTTIQLEAGNVVKSLVQLVQNNQHLVKLKLHLYRCDIAMDTDSVVPSPPLGNTSDCDTWYMGPLAQALSLPSLHATSQLASLHFTKDLGEPLQAWKRVYTLSEKLNILQQCHGVPMLTLETMVRNNYNIKHLHIGRWSDLEHVDNDDDNDDDNGDNPTERRLGSGNELAVQSRHFADCDPKRQELSLGTAEFFLGLNRLGRKRLICDPNTTMEDWIQAVSRATRRKPAINHSLHELSNIFYWLSMNPSIIYS